MPCATVIHNPPSCTCRRIIWLSEHCDTFSLTVTQTGARINARLADKAIDNTFAYTRLSEAIAEAFWQIWQRWQPEDGLKIA